MDKRTSETFDLTQDPQQLMDETEYAGPGYTASLLPGVMLKMADESTMPEFDDEVRGVIKAQARHRQRSHGRRYEEHFYHVLGLWQRKTEHPCDRCRLQGLRILPWDKQHLAAATQFRLEIAK